MERPSFSRVEKTRLLLRLGHRLATVCSAGSSIRV